MQRASSLEKTLMLGKTEDRRRRGWQRMRGLDSITGWANSRKQWRTEGPGVLRPMGLRSRMWLSNTLLTDHSEAPARTPRFLSWGRAGQGRRLSPSPGLSPPTVLHCRLRPKGDVCWRWGDSGPTSCAPRLLQCCALLAPSTLLPGHLPLTASNLRSQACVWTEMKQPLN